MKEWYKGSVSLRYYESNNRSFRAIVKHNFGALDSALGPIPSQKFSHTLAFFRVCFSLGKDATFTKSSLLKWTHIKQLESYSI